MQVDIAESLAMRSGDASPSEALHSSSAFEVGPEICFPAFLTSTLLRMLLLGVKSSCTSPAKGQMKQVTDSLGFKDIVNFCTEPIQSKANHSNTVNTIQMTFQETFCMD